MTFHKFKTFDFLYDGNYSLAKDIVQVYDNSQAFALATFPGQDDFYNDYLSKYYEMVKEVNADVPNRRNQKVPEVIYQVLTELKDDRKLNFSHFLYAFSRVLMLWDDNRYMDIIDPILGRDSPWLTKNMYQRIDPTILSISADQVYQEMSQTVQQFPFIVPFTSKTGAFGVNTFLFMWFNGILPVACSLRPYSVHAGQFKDSAIAIMQHDLSHFRNMRHLASSRFPMGIENDILNKQMVTDDAYFEWARALYLKIINSNLPEEQQKGMIAVIYALYHEGTGSKFTCPDFRQSFREYYLDPETAILFLDNTFYPSSNFLTPEQIMQYRNLKYLRRQVNADSPSKILMTYLAQTIDLILTDICHYFGG